MTETRERRQVLLFCSLTDAVVLWAALNAATLTRLPTLVFLEDLWLLRRDQFVCLALFLVAMDMAGAYRPSRITDRFDSAFFACLGLVVAAFVLVAVATLLPRDAVAISRRELILGPGIATAVFIPWRFYLGGLASRFASLHRSFYVLGTEDEARRIADEITTNPSVRADARYVTLEELRAEVAEVETGTGPFSSVNRDAIITLTRADRHELIPMLEFCESHIRRTFVYPSLHDMLFFPHSELLAIAGIPLIEVSNTQSFTPYVYMKRVMDVFAAGIGLLLLSPVGLATAAAIKLTSRGPVFYTQERVGKAGRRFRLYKFRSMVADAEASTGPVWAKADDARVTAVGRFLRKHRIDEIPQLINVLKGDMSLIGPRPERPHFHEEFCAQWPLFERRLAVRPGVTSLSHVLGAYDSEPEDRLRYDLMYISSLSLVTDMRILLATVRVVLGAKGAQ